jgi:hypothetical protein
LINHLSVRRFVFDESDDFVVHGFFTGFAEMNTYTVICSADTFREYSRVVCFFILFVTFTNIVVVDSHPFILFFQARFGGQ